jgi:DNA repair exonuclease SbcCD ATPase subunit
MATPTPTIPPPETGDTVQSSTIAADQIRLDPNEAPEEETSEMKSELGELFEDDAAAPPPPEPAPAPAAKPPAKIQDLEPGAMPDKLPKAEIPEEEPEPDAKPETAKPAAEVIKPHTEFADARSLRPAYEALRVRCESIEKSVADKDARIADLTKQIEDIKPVKEEAEQLRARVNNVHFRDTEPYQQAVIPLRQEAESILARASELATSDGKRDPDKITDAIRRMTSLPDRGQRRQLAQEVFEDADVAEAVTLASELADVDRRYRTTDKQWSEKSGEFLKNHKVQEVTSTRQAAQAVEQEVLQRMPFIKDPALQEAREIGDKYAEALLQLDDMAPRQRRAVIPDLAYRIKLFDPLWAAAYQMAGQLKIANAALKKKGITMTTGGGAPVTARAGNGGAEPKSLDEELQADWEKLTST